MALQDDRTRRAFSRSVTVLLGAALAGCTSDALGDAYSDPPEHTPIGEACEREHQEVLDLRVRNRDAEPHVVELTVTGEREGGPSEPFFEETYELGPGELAARAVAFDPDADDVDRYDDFVARATTADGRTDTDGAYSTVVGNPLRSGLWITVESDGGLSVGEVVWDPPANYDGETC